MGHPNEWYSNNKQYKQLSSLNQNVTINVI